MFSRAMVLPNFNLFSIANVEARTYLDNFSAFKYTLPSIQSWCWFLGFHKRVIWKKKTSLKDSVEKWVCTMHEMPSLFGKKRIIKQCKVSKTHPTNQFRLCQICPLNPMDLPFVTSLAPIFILTIAFISWQSPNRSVRDKFGQWHFDWFLWGFIHYL